MMTCKDCFHWKVCKTMLEASHGYILPDDFEGNAERCPDFIRADRVIVPPCKVGQTVYKVHYPLKSICEYTVKAIYFTEDKKYYPKPHIIVHHEFSRGRLRLNFTEIGKTVFLTREEAEKALAERSGE